MLCRCPVRSYALRVLMPPSAPGDQEMGGGSWGSSPLTAAGGGLPAHLLGHLPVSLICFLSQSSLPRLEAECSSFYIFCLFFPPFPALRQERVSDLCYSSMATIRLHSEFPYITNSIKHSALRFCWIWTRLSGENGLQAELASLASAVSPPCNV